MRRSRGSTRSRLAGFIAVSLVALGVVGPAALAGEVTGTIVPGGDPVTITIVNVDDNGRLTFEGTAGQRVFVKASAGSLGGVGVVTVSLLKPDGGSLGSSGWIWSNTTGFVDTKTLPSAGTYSVFIDPFYNTTGSVTVTLYDVPADASASVTPGGDPVTLSTSTPGQNAGATFTGSSGQRVSVKVDQISMGGGYVNAWIKKPDGSQLGSSTGNTSSWGWIDTVTLPSAGTYMVVVDPMNDATGSARVKVHDVPADLASPVAITGSSQALSLATPGQNARLPFAAAAGQQLRLSWSSSISVGANFAILRPNGSQLASSGNVGPGAASITTTLDTTGTHYLLVDPFVDSTGSATIWLSIFGDAPNDGASVVCGEAVAVAEPVAGATAYQFQYATDSGFASVVDDSGFVPSTNTYAPAPEKLKNGATYYWRWRTSTGSWSSARSFTVSRPLLGARDYWPIWSQGPLAVNQATGNLVLSLPGPSYPTVAGAMAVSLAYNSLDGQNRGLGAGWALVGGDERGEPPTVLVDRRLLTGAATLDAVEALYADGSSTCFLHVGQTNTYRPEAGDGSQLSKNPDGSWTLVDGEAIYSYGIADGSTGKATLTGVEYVDAGPGKGKLTYAYSAQDPAKLTSITDEAGRSLTLTWNSLNPSGCSDAIVCISGPDSVSWRVKGDGTGGTSGRLARIHDGARDLYAVSYDASTRVNKLQNANDLDPTSASPGYDSTHSVTVAYDGSSRVSSVSDGPISGQTPATSTWSFAYAPGTVSTTATRAAHDGISQGTVRTADGYTTVTPPRQQGEPTPKVIKTYYDNLAHPIEVVDQLGNITMAGYNSRDQLLWTEDGDGNPTDYSWDTVNDALSSVTGPDPDGGGPLARLVTGYRYDEKAIGTSSSPGAALQGLQASYYANANLAGRAAARQTDSGVDFNWGTGGPSALTVADNFSIRWTGNLIVTSAGSYTFSTVSDEGTRLTLDGLQLINNWTDQTVTSVSSPAVTLTAGTHKLLLEYYDRTGPAEVHLRWSCTGCSPAIADQVIPSSSLRPAWLNQTSTVSPLGKVAFSHYADPASGRADYTLAKLDDGTNVITSFAYDSWGRVTQKVMPEGNAGRTIDSDGTLQGSPNTTYATSWAYYGLTETAAPPAACGGGSAVSQAGLPKSITPNGIAATTTVYDTAGRTIATTNGAGTTCRTYTSEGRLSAEQAPGDSQATTYAYDPAGARRTASDASDASGTITSDYDEAGRVKRSVDSYGAEATFAYDAESNLIQRIAAAGSLSGNPNYQTSYGYDPEGKLSSITDPAGRSYGFFYDSRGNLKASQYPNGTFAWNDYNQAGWLTGVYNRHGTLMAPLPGSVPSDASPVADYAYTYELEGRKTQEVRTGGGLSTETTTYGYDALGRLKDVTLPGGIARTYGFDLDSNRTAIVENSQTVASYTYNPATTQGVDQLTSVTEGGSTRTFSYDSDGNTTTRGSDTLTWDGWGRHNGGTFGGTSVSYGFDPLGIRRSRTSGATTTRYLHGGLFETTASGSITLTDIDGPAGDLAQYSGPPTTGTTGSFVYYNGHGDLAATADTSGTRTAAFTYDPFGALRSGSAGNGATERFTGRWDKKLDTTSGLFEMGARPYDSSLGRFLAVDPIEGGALNSYDYAYQDPINVYDLSGQCPICVIGVIVVVGLVAGGTSAYVAYDQTKAKGDRLHQARSDRQKGKAGEKQLTEAEQTAIENRNAGLPYDKKAYKSAMQKKTHNEKIAGERNKPKRTGGR